MSNKLVAMALVVGGCHAALPAHPLAKLDVDTTALAAELRRDGGALASNYVRGSFAFGHEQDASVTLSTDAAIDAAYKLGAMLVHPDRSIVTCANQGSGVVCTQGGGPVVTLWLVRETNGLSLRSAAITAPPVPVRAPTTGNGPMIWFP